MGMGVALNGILTLSACPSGLRISIWKIFGPFQRPLFIPWTDIRTTPSRSFLVSTVKLTFGTPPVGTLKIDARSWERLHHTADNSGAEGLPSALPSVSKGQQAEPWCFSGLSRPWPVDAFSILRRGCKAHRQPSLWQCALDSRLFYSGLARSCASFGKRDPQSLLRVPPTKPP
jgi:hypothetical protein